MCSIYTYQNNSIAVSEITLAPHLMVMAASVHPRHLMLEVIHGHAAGRLCPLEEHTWIQGSSVVNQAERVPHQNQQMSPLPPRSTGPTSSILTTVVDGCEGCLAECCRRSHSIYLHQHYSQYDC
jgi:hypothetical protein